jgi:hypothetical protein
MKRCHVVASALLFASLGCEPQATTEYEGDPMFSLNGRVAVGLTESGDALIPSIAFNAPGADRIGFVDAQVRGEFPAQFQLELFAPPPEEVIGGFDHEDLPEEPRHTVGFISAVTADHLPTLYQAASLTGAELDPSIEADENGCDEDGCYQTLTATSSDSAYTGTVTLFREGDVGNLWDPFSPGVVVVARTGDPMLVSYADDPMFAGVTTNYAIAYLESAAPADGVVAHRFGAAPGQALAPGYHLLRWGGGSLTEAEATALQTCRDDALQIAVDRYNAAHDTNLNASDIHVQGNETGAPTVGEHTRRLRGEWLRAMAEMDCAYDGNAFSVVEDPAQAMVSLEVQPGLSFTKARIDHLSGLSN